MLENSARTSQKRQPSARSLATRERIMLAAERLFGSRGIDDVSLREIAATAGQANSNAVQYHFANKETLIQSILEYRVQQLEELRRPLMAEAEKRGQGHDLKTLLSILFLPQLELVDENGKHPYARFLSEYLVRYRPRGILHPGDKGSPSIAVPILLQCMSRIAAQLYYLPPEIIHLRTNTCTTMFLTMVVQNDMGLLYESRPVPLDIAVDESLQMMMAVLLAPPSPAVRHLSPDLWRSSATPNA